MPTAIQWLTMIVPARYLIPSLQSVFLAGDIWPLFLQDIARCLRSAPCSSCSRRAPPESGSAEMWDATRRRLIVKELLAVLRDPKSRDHLIVPPLVQLLVFSYAATLEVKNVRPSGAQRRQRSLEPGTHPAHRGRADFPPS